MQVAAREFHSLWVKTVFKPSCSALDTAEAVVRGKKPKDMAGWVCCIPQNACGFSGAVNMVSGLEGWRLMLNE